MKAYNNRTKIATILSHRFAKIRHEDSEVTRLTKKYLRKPLKKAANPQTSQYGPVCCVVWEGRLVRGGAIPMCVHSFIYCLLLIGYID